MVATAAPVPVVTLAPEVRALIRARLVMHVAAMSDSELVAMAGDLLEAETLTSAEREAVAGDE